MKKSIKHIILILLVMILFNDPVYASIKDNSGCYKVHQLNFLFSSTQYYRTDFYVDDDYYYFVSCDKSNKLESLEDKLDDGSLSIDSLAKYGITYIKIASDTMENVKNILEDIMIPEIYSHVYGDYVYGDYGQTLSKISMTMFDVDTPKDFSIKIDFMVDNLSNSITFRVVDGEYLKYLSAVKTSKNASFVIEKIYLNILNSIAWKSGYTSNEGAVVYSLKNKNSYTYSANGFEIGSEESFKINLNKVDFSNNFGSEEYQEKISFLYRFMSYAVADYRSLYRFMSYADYCSLDELKCQFYNDLGDNIYTIDFNNNKIHGYSNNLDINKENEKLVRNIINKFVYVYSFRDYSFLEDGTTRNFIDFTTTNLKDYNFKKNGIEYREVDKNKKETYSFYFNFNNVSLNISNDDYEISNFNLRDIIIIGVIASCLLISTIILILKRKKSK